MLSPSYFYCFAPQKVQKFKTEALSHLKLYFIVRIPKVTDVCGTTNYLLRLCMLWFPEAVTVKYRLLPNGWEKVHTWHVQWPLTNSKIINDTNDGAEDHCTFFWN